MSEALPKLRFPEFTAPWKPAHAGDAFRSSRTRGQDGLPIYSVTLDRGLVPRSSLERHLAADAADEQNLRAKPGDLVYNTMRMWQGAVGRADVDCMVSPAYVVLAPKKGASSAFFNYWFQHPRMRYLLGAYSHGLTRDRLRLYPDDFAQIPLSLPEPAEQKRIAQTIEAVDRKIALLREEREAIEAYKAGMVDRLFGRETRFVREDGTAYSDWVPKKLGDLLSFKNGLNAEKTRYGRGTKFVNVLDVLNREPIRSDNIAGSVSVTDDEIRAFGLQYGDILFQRSSETREDAGQCNVYLDEVAAVFGGFVIRGRPIAEVEPRFLQALLRTSTVRRAIQSHAGGSTRYNVGQESLAQLDVKMPACFEEQDKIANTLALIDARIGGILRQIDGITAFRRGLIERLFP